MIPHVSREGKFIQTARSRLPEVGIMGNRWLTVTEFLFKMTEKFWKKTAVMVV